MASANPTYPIKTIAKLLMLTERRVQQLTKEGVISKEGRGQYELAASVQGYITYLKDRLAGDSDESGAINHREQQARYQKARADLAEMDADEQRGDLVHITVAGELWSQMASNMSTAVQGLGSRVSPLVVGNTDIKSVHKIINKECENILNELSTDIKYKTTRGD